MKKRGKEKGRRRKSVGLESWFITIFKRSVPYVAFLKYLLFTLGLSK